MSMLTTDMAGPMAERDMDNIEDSSLTVDRSTFRTIDTVKHIWKGLRLPTEFVQLELDSADESDRHRLSRLAISLKPRSR